MRLLITGASGMLGHSLMRLAAQEHEVWGAYRSFPVTFGQAQTFALDLLDHARVRARVTGLRPGAIIHAAALTDVEMCERDPLMARQLNLRATENLAMVAGELGIHFVYISTDYVFDGAKGRYAETDLPNPRNVYGETKFLGEKAAAASCSKTLVIRTSIFGFHVQPKSGVVEYVADRLKKGETITRFVDQFSTPIYTGDLSRLILKLLARECVGPFHVGGSERLSRYDFALKIAELFSLPSERVRPVPFEQQEGGVRRPLDSSLTGEKAESCLGVPLPKVEEGLARLRGDLRSHRESTNLKTVP